MPFMFVPPSVSSITISGAVLVPVNSEVSVSAADLTALAPIQAQPYLVSTNVSTGAAVLNFPSQVTSITINGNVYVPDGSGNISAVPAADATNFFRRLKGHPFRYSRP